MNCIFTSVLNGMFSVVVIPVCFDTLEVCTSCMCKIVLDLGAVIFQGHSHAI